MRHFQAPTSESPYPLVDALRDDYTLRGFISLPTLNRANAQLQFLFVNGRPVKDKLFAGAVRAAYQDFLAYNNFSGQYQHVNVSA